MTRTVRDAKLESRASRSGLKPAGKPYFRAIESGLHLGYRRKKTGGVWVMRRYLGAQGYRLETIGTADDALDADGALVLTFAQAQGKARALFMERGRVDAGLPTERGAPYTVAVCLSEYVAWLKQNGKTGPDAEWRSAALIIPTLGKIECSKLTTKQVADWLAALASGKARIRTKKEDAQRFRQADDTDPEEAQRRRRASANRVLTILKAALNRAWREKKIPSDVAWRAVSPFKGANAARVRYLTIPEAQRLINASAPDFRRLVRAALMTGARYGELGALEVGDFNQDSRTLHIRKSKSGKARHVVLTDEAADLFKSLILGKGARDRLLVKEDGTRWGVNHQTRPMLAACAAGSIEPPANFHALRHSNASHLIMNGAPLLVVAKNLGHADTRMVERHYGHLSPSYVADAIRAAAPTFGFKAEADEGAVQ